MLGHDWAVTLLQNHLRHGRIRHAYLFTGPQGLGRRTLALKLAQGINCEQSQSPGMPCGVCRNCRLIERMEHPDLTIVQADRIGGNLKVDQIRELQHRLSLSPYESKYRVALLLRFEEANANAANALLKTLEEPPPHVIMMLTSQDAQGLLPTIVSRCELIRLRSLAVNTLSKSLETRPGLPADEANLLAHISAGRPGVALSLHQDPDLSAQRQTWLEEHQRLLSANRVERFEFAERLATDREAQGDFIQAWSSYWRDVLLVASGSTVSVINLDWKPAIVSLANQLDLSKAVQILTALDHTSSLLSQNANPRLTLEVLMLDLPYIPG